MKTKRTVLALVAVLFSSINAQSQDKAQIEKTLETYFDGWQTGDTLKLGKVIHQTCKLKNIKENKVDVIDRKTYLSRFELHPKAENTGGKILNIDITGNTAAAKCQIETPKMLITDYFNLMKVNGQWYIVDKIFSRAEKK
ncbi:nuclear transport factor 2 family protein [Flavobacterium amniphilum]|uniref:nuclear transport factor 2 family protein n=1 Tax=Flavobacterium amniphilum TaxID=1834035 RepID=UPI00202A8315|nr:nuclear transport factor 2 family protein [Flavobacterium amniphilum]MCL9807007.1 nuclear transport factor 2 family protein [Flavobacterium amniphilum]